MSEVSIFSKRTRNSVLNKAQLYHKVDGSEDPVSDGQYNGSNWLDTSEDMCPIFSAEEQKWFFAGTQEDVEKLLDNTVLTHEFGPKEGQRIEANDVNFYNAKDPLFNHSAFKRFTEKSKLALSHDNPLERFLYLCLTALDDTLAPDEDNPAVSDDTRYSIIEAGAEQKRETETVTNKMDAITVINQMDHNKLLSVCRALNHPVFYPSLDTPPETLKTSAFYQLVEEGADMKDKEGVLYLNRLMELSKLTKRELEIQELLGSAFKKGVISIRRDGNFYLFRDRDNNEILDGIIDEKNLAEKLLTKDGVELKNGDDLLGFLRARFSDK